jgi:uncharacterized protein (UPF0147 family)
MFTNNSQKCGEFICNNKVVQNVPINMDFFKKTYKAIISTKQPRKYTKTSKDISYLKNIIKDNNFVPEDVRAYIYSVPLSAYSYTYHNLTVNVYGTILVTIDSIIHIYLFMQLLSGQSPESLEINIVPTNLLKKIPPPRNPKFLGPDSINTGSRYKNIITIWRQEELLKVLIHELVHYFGFDSAITKTYRANIDGTIRLSEAYTEAVAITIHCVYVLSSLYQTFSEENCKKILLYEINFSIYQCSKILGYFDITSLDQLSPKFKQTTDVFSYYFIKTIFLLSNDFYDMINKDIYATNNNISKLLNNKTTWGRLNEYINKYKYAAQNCEFVTNTLRMSCIERGVTTI